MNFFVTYFDFLISVFNIQFSSFYLERTAHFEKESAQ